MNFKKGGDPMTDNNIFPIRKSDRFHLILGTISTSGEVKEAERVGIAFLKPGSNTFRLKIWTFPEGEYYLAREADDHNQYVALVKEEYASNGEGKVQWHKIGVGEVVGNFIRIHFHLISGDVFLCLFPKNAKSGVADAA